MTLDISERGLRIKAKESLALNSMVEFALDLPGHSQEVKAYGRVVRVYDKEEGAYQMALAIMDIDSREYLTLTRYLRTQGPTAGGESKPD